MDSIKKFKSKKRKLIKAQEGGEIKPKSTWARAFYNAWDPLDAPPTGVWDAIAKGIYTTIKAFKNPDTKEWPDATNIGELVAEAAHRKRIGYSYDKKYLPVWNGDTVRLHSDVEKEIPTDTNMLKQRIANTERLMKLYDKYYRNSDINIAYNADKQALEALRKTYATGEPVGMNEVSWNSRLWVKDGVVLPTISPLAVMSNYVIRWDKPTKTMYYSDDYGFNGYDWIVPGKAFQIRGTVPK